jgi:hypothetical protein
MYAVKIFAFVLFWGIAAFVIYQIAIAANHKGRGR